MPKVNTEKIIRALIVFLAIEQLSFLSFAWPLVGQVSLLALVVGTIILASYKLEYGFLVVLAELFIGSMGHLFKVDIAGYSVPLRISLWLAIMAVFSFKLLYQLIKNGQASAYWQSLCHFKEKKFFLILAGFVVIGIISGLLNHHPLSLIGSDVNSWLYFLLIGPAWIIYNDQDEKKIENLRNLFIAGSLWLSLKTLFLLFIFTHNINSAPEVYLWLRQTIVGEMTPTKSGWPRIFIQGQIYSVIAFLFAFWLNCGTRLYQKYSKKIKILSLFFAAVFLSAVLLSFSRSFWVSLMTVLLFLLIVIWQRQGFKASLKSAAWLVLSGIMSFSLIYLVVAFPYLHFGGSNFGSVFLDRVSNNNEAALSSRWSLLPVLTREVLKEPLLGQGYGTTVTYISYDPRILQQDLKGRYTTYAFEWGYLDLALKIGLLGLLAYLWLLGKLIFDSFIKGQKLNDDYLFIPLAGALLFLVVTHMFTPYLNHPLGIGWIVISSCLIWRNRVY